MELELAAAGGQGWPSVHKYRDMGWDELQPEEQLFEQKAVDFDILTRGGAQPPRFWKSWDSSAQVFDVELELNYSEPGVRRLGQPRYWNRGCKWKRPTMVAAIVPKSWKFHT